MTRESVARGEAASTEGFVLPSNPNGLFPWRRACPCTHRHRRPHWRSSCWSATDLRPGHPKCLVIAMVPFRSVNYPLVMTNIAMENGPFIDGLPIKNGDFPWLC